MLLSSYNFPAASGILIGISYFLSWIGYGYLISRILKIENLSWAFLACIGLSALMLIGGLQALLGVISETLNFVIMLIGIGLFFSWLTKVKKDLSADFMRSPFGIIAVFLMTVSLAMIVVRFTGSVLPFWLDECDDLIAYFYFPRLMLDTGSFIDPFGLRRLVMLGGAPYIQSFLYPVLGISSLPFIDVGLGTILLWGIVRGIFREETSSLALRLKKEAAGLAAIIFASAMIYYNHAPLLLPCALMTSVFILCLRLSGKEFRASDLVVIGIVSAGLISVRNNYVIPVVIFLFLFILFAIRGDAKQKAGFFFIVSAVIFLSLLPWMIVSYKSSGTPFYPILKGFHTFPFGFKQPMDLMQKAYFILDKIWTSKALILLFPILISVVLKANSRFVLAAAISALSSVVIMSLSLTASDSFNIYRYVQPFVFACLLASTGAIAREGFSGISGVKRVLIAAASSAAFLWWLLAPSQVVFHGPLIQKFKIQNLNLVLSNSKKFFLSTKIVVSNAFKYLDLYNSTPYKQAQDFIPEGARVLSVTAKPFLLDLKRHQIYSIDCIGQASQPPGLPFFSGPDAVVQYLKNLGYRYIIYTPFESQNCLYSYQRWSHMLRKGVFIYRNWAPYFLDFFDNINAMERRDAIVYQNAELKVIDLERLKVQTE